MKIAIAERFRPFSHMPGFRCLFPGTSQIIRVFPAWIEIEGKGTVELPVTGPVKAFTGIMDLEKPSLSVFGQAQAGYYKVEIMLDPINSNLTVGSQVFQLNTPVNALMPAERLSLGCQKAMDWQMMRRRALLEEWIPLWHWMGQTAGPIHQVPRIDPKNSLLGLCLHADNMAVGNLLMQSLEAGFEEFFAPSADRWKKLGLSLPPLVDGSLLQTGAAMIRQLFIQECGSSLLILPRLPHELHCGRYVNASFDCGCVDLEWSKRKIRRMVIRSNKNYPLSLEFKNKSTSYRIRTSVSSKGVRMNHLDPIELKEGNSYYLDQFEQ